MRANPCVLVIFGGTGDLTKRLLLPAIANLGSNDLLDDKFSIIGIGRTPLTDEAYRGRLKDDIKTFMPNHSAQKFAESLLNHIYYVPGDVSDSHLYNELSTKLSELENQVQTKNVLFYFAVPPEAIETIAKGLAQSHLLNEENGQFYRRLIIEKPFGHDLESAKKLNKLLIALADETQIFRIDHYLGKETVQNILAFRFSNSIFEPIWNHHYIDHVQITVAETLGVEDRGEYYDKVGALRDMVPNHLFQVLSLIAMEPPIAFTENYLQDEREKVLHSMPIMTPEQVLQRAVRGQYDAGSIDSTHVPAYRSEPNLNPQSDTETYVALKLFVDNWRWLHVPFYIRTGKRMKNRVSEILIQFKSAPSTLFSGLEQKIMPNLLTMNIQPEEGISLRFGAKIPGPTLKLGQVNMDFKYSDYFGKRCQTGYETLLYDCMNGNHTFFERADMEETGWALVQPILDVWAAIPPRNFPNYAAGSWGPEEANELIQRDGREWML